MKGQQEVISIILISGILIGVVGSVYLWGVPLIQKNKDIATLESAEDFMKALDTKMRFIANNGGRDQVALNVPAVLKFDGQAQQIMLVVDTEGTIYSTGAEIPLGKNDCTSETGTFGVSDPQTLCVKSVRVGSKNFRTTYTLSYVKLMNSAVLKDFQINMTGPSATGGQKSSLVMENLGNSQSAVNGRSLISTLISINIV